MGPRILTLGHMAKAIKTERKEETTDPEMLLPGQMRLYSYYRPGLVAGSYMVEAKQTITTFSTPEVGVSSLDVWNTTVGDTTNALAGQTFNVVVPRFTLDPAIINSYYPPDGHQDEGRILPHIVLNDPHYPWEVAAGNTGDNMREPVDLQHIPKQDGTAERRYRGLVPWVALLVFDPAELRLTADEGKPLLKPTGLTPDFNKQDPKGVFRMKVSDYFNIDQSSRINFEAGIDNFSGIRTTEGNVDVIFPTKAQFLQIFQNAADTDTNKLGVEAFKYMSHVRHILTDGIPDAGVEEHGLFSIVISPRTGAYNITTPTTQICHLVSIENVDSTLSTSWLTKDPVVDRIGMISLFSWIYTALPPNPVNFVDTVRNLTENQQMLTVDQNVLQDLSKQALATSPAWNATISRLDSGYTLARWRTQTGECTVAFNRGPLVPQPVPWPGTATTAIGTASRLADTIDSSNTSQDYQILDQQTGIMDVSYASAWQVGKLLAISDTVFSAALMRFRSLVHNATTQKTLMEVNNVLPIHMILASTSQRVADVKSRSIKSAVDPQRVKPVAKNSPTVDLHSPSNLPKFAKNVHDVVGTHAGSGEDPIYNDFNEAGANNSDWAIIHTWLCDKLHLGGIPNHYLFPEPAFLPSESLRFFYIDNFWLDCLIDGALSVANHLDVDDDIIRRTIKQWFNLYLRTPVPDANYAPQIPCYGFVIRSKLIQAMPDLRITVTWTPAPGVSETIVDKRATVCRWTRIDNETLMCLLDRQPEELASIVLAQPPHQQRFSFGAYLDAEAVTFHMRTLYTQGAPTGEWREKYLDPKQYPVNSWFNFESRMLHIQVMADQLNKALRFGPQAQKDATSPGYADTQSNSCEFGLELNDPSYYFKITPTKNATFTQRVRQLYVRERTKTDYQEPTEVSTTKRVLLTAKDEPNPPPPAALHLQEAKKPTATAASKPSPTLHVPRGPSKQLKIQPTNLSRRSPPTASGTTLHAFSRSSISANFDIYIYPDHHQVPERLAVAHGFRTYNSNDFIPTLNQYFFDLIFSIRKRDSVDVQIKNPDGSIKHDGTTAKLLKIEVDIPMETALSALPGGPPLVSSQSSAGVAGHKNVEPLLTDNYDGPGVHMLSNQRFVPFLFYHVTPDMGSTLHIELIPRSKALLDPNGNSNFVIRINNSKTDEISFSLGEANICPIRTKTQELIDGIPKDADHGRGECAVAMTEWYSTTARPEGEPARTQYSVLKWDTRDD
ncbi:hypothetical protein EDD37DRAFT_664816 [Exophiala viscosa]|uniref:uncharacterized protein n=1 Tax=Exophiala viscosa TaxID=2486360 RepID=UPI00219AE067|nr:hypothetical protein EDD37DRAFT_664816 [Exophiala viscosa]